MVRVILMLAVSLSLLLVHTPGYSADDSEIWEGGHGDEGPGRGKRPKRDKDNTPFKGCICYQEARFWGNRLVIKSGRSVKSISRLNDSISSIKCSKGCGLQVWKDLNFKGDSTIFDGATDFVGEAWNDRISSMRVLCD